MLNLDTRILERLVLKEAGILKDICINLFEFHSRLQDYLFFIAKYFGKNGAKEYKVSIREDRRGSIDVAWFNGGELYAVIEIDSSPRCKSILKLLQQNVKYRIWIFYGNAYDGRALLDKIDKDNNIILIQLGNICKLLHTENKVTDTSIDNKQYTIKKNSKNAYKAWTWEEDNALLKRFDENYPIKELSRIHLRTEGAIKSRLSKHGRI